MAKDRAKLTRRRTIFSKIESTTGTEQTLASADFVEAISPTMTFDNTYMQRQGAGLGFRRGVPGLQSGATTFQTEFRNSGSATLPLGYTLLQAAGFKLSTNTLSLAGVADTGDTATVGMYTDGTFKSLAGVQFNVKLTGEVGKPVMAEWTGKGKRTIGSSAGPRDLSQPTITQYASLPPTVKGITLTLATVSYCFETFVLDMGNDVQIRPCGTDATGVYSAQIVSRNITFTLDPEMKALATKDWFDAYETGAEIALSIIIGSGSNNVLTIAAGKLQLMTPPEDQDKAGFLRMGLTFQLNETSGDDELTIVAS